MYNDYYKLAPMAWSFAQRIKNLRLNSRVIYGHLRFKKNIYNAYGVIFANFRVGPLALLGRDKPLFVASRMTFNHSAVVKAFASLCFLCKDS
ncbi:MAG: hypothetical protein MJZ20_11795, partial [Bacteroidaceae bacterium]|nr:hypothetical protein [Bacteroidaceae bacterium]